MKSTIDVYLKDYEFSPVLLNKLYHIFQQYPDHRTAVSVRALELIFSNGNEFKLYAHTLELVDYLRKNGIDEISIDLQLYNLNDMRNDLISYKRGLFNRLKNLHRINDEEILSKEILEYDDETEQDIDTDGFDNFKPAKEDEDGMSNENTQISSSSIDLYYQDSIDKLCGIIKSQDYDRMIDGDEVSSHARGGGGGSEEDDDEDDEMKEDDFNVPSFKNELSEDDEMVGITNTGGSNNHDLNSKFLQTYKLIDSKNNLKLMVFNSSVNIINDNNYFFVKLLDEKLTNLFKSFVIRDFYRIILFKSFDYKIKNMIDYYNRKLENLLEISQQEDEDVNDEDDDSIDDNKGDNAAGSRSEEPEMSVGVKLNQEEIIAYYNCKFDLIYLYFIINDYSNVIKEFEKLSDIENVGGIKGIKPFENVLGDEEKFDNILIYRSYLIYCLLFSMMLCKTNVEFEKIINTNEIFKDFLKLIESKDDESKVVFVEIIETYLNCDFAKLFQLIDALNTEYLRYDLQLFKSCENFKMNLRRKSIVFYLSIVQKIKISKIRTKFYNDEIDTEFLIDELNYLIKIMNFENVKIDLLDMTVEFKEISNSSHQDLNNLQKVNQMYHDDYESIRLNAMMNGF